MTWAMGLLSILQKEEELCYDYVQLIFYLLAVSSYFVQMGCSFLWHGAF